MGCYNIDKIKDRDRPQEDRKKSSPRRSKNPGSGLYPKYIQEVRSNGWAEEFKQDWPEIVSINMKQGLQVSGPGETIVDKDPKRIIRLSKM